jgi:predicted RNA methylase
MTNESVWLPDASQTKIGQQFRHLLKATGYIDSGIEEVMEPRSWIPLLPDASAEATPLNTFLRLFHMKRFVRAEDAAEALRPLTLEQAVAAHYLKRDGDQVSATVVIEPFCGLLVARPRDADDENKLMSVSLTTMEVAQFAIRRHSRKTLDLGTGTGVQAMLAAKHSDEVYAVDINPRAVATAAFNCRWNGCDNVTCLEGSLFAPVAGHRFDLIVCNPPFVISPGVRHRYRDSGVAGDQFALDVARQAASFLNEGGCFQMMFQWIETEKAGWRDKLSVCFSGLGCDVWVLRTDTEAPEAYVAGWLGANSEKADPADASYACWLRYLEDLEATSIGTGLLVMERRNRSHNHLWFDEAPEERSQPYGDAIPAILTTRRHLETLTDDSLLDERLVAAKGLRMVEDSRLAGGQWRMKDCEIQMQSGLRYCFDEVDPTLARIVAACDGRQTLQEIVQALPSDARTVLGMPGNKHLRQVRDLMWYGFLQPGRFADEIAIETNGITNVRQPSSLG